MGLAIALGYHFFDKQNHRLQGGGKSLTAIDRIDVSKVDQRIFNTKFEIACDVDNPLTGKQGAAFVYAPQKGAMPDDLQGLDEGLINIARVIQSDLGRNIADVKGAGAAGGLGAGLLAFCDAQLKPGAELVLDLLGFKAALADADLVITTEGCLDAQTSYGKAPFVVAQQAKAADVPCVVIAGIVAITDKEVRKMGFNKVYSLTDRETSTAKAMQYAFNLLKERASQVARDFYHSN